MNGRIEDHLRGADPRIRRAEPYTKRLWVNHYLVTSVDDLDDTFAGWVGEAHAVGHGAHLLG